MNNNKSNIKNCLQNIETTKKTEYGLWKTVKTIQSEIAYVFPIPP